MNLFLLRHGTAESCASGGDAERALTPKGLQQCQRVGEFLRSQAIMPHTIVSSPYRRALQTAESVARAAGWAGQIAVDGRLVPHAGTAAALELVRELQAETVLLVGHEPLLSALAAHIIGDERARIDLRKAGLLELALPSTAEMRGDLLGLLRPGHLAP